MGRTRSRDPVSVPREIDGRLGFWGRVAAACMVVLWCFIAAFVLYLIWWFVIARWYE
jgi:hypothetical protein